MPNKNLISLNVIIDRSGSMKHLSAETVGGFNKLIEDQRKEPGEVMFSLTLFDDKLKIVYDSVPLSEVQPLTEDMYWQGGGGWTALNDALGMTTQRVQERIASMPEDLKPNKVLFTVITDGEENQSKEFTLDSLRTLIEKARSEWKYEFTLIGANIDALFTAKSMGINPANAVNFNATAGSMRNVMNVASAGTSAYRGGATRSAANLYGAIRNVADVDDADMEALKQQFATSMSSTPDTKDE